MDLRREEKIYTHEDHLRAVKLYMKYDHSISAVIQEVGCPSHQAVKTGIKRTYNTR